MVKGYVDFIFYPESDKSADCIILELKVGHSPEEAIRQVKEKNYALRFHGKMAVQHGYTGRVLRLVYDIDELQNIKVLSCRGHYEN